MQPKQSADLIVEARWVMPIAPINRIFADHAVVVTEGRIVAVGPAAQVAARFAARERITRPDHLLLPGLVNAHTQAAATLLRGLPRHRSHARWVRETLLPAEARSLSPDFVRAGTQLAIAQLLQAGVTAFADVYLFPEEAARAAAAARVRACIGLPVAEGPSAWADSATGYLERGEALRDEYQSDPWVSLYFAPQSLATLGEASLTRVRRVADELDARVAMPVHETQAEIDRCFARGGRRPLAQLADLGLLRPGFTAIHMNHLDAADRELSERTGIAVVACPQESLRQGGASCPVAELSAAGVTVGLGTGSAASARGLDVLYEAGIACLLANRSEPALKSYHGGLIRDGDPEEKLELAFAAADALRLATLGGATAIGLGALVGSLEQGKAADMITIDLSPLACQLSGSVADAALHGAGRQQVTDVWIGGRAAIAAGRPLSFDAQELKRLASEWSQRLGFGELR